MHKILILFRPDTELKDSEVNEELLIGIDNKELDGAYFFKEFKTIGELQAYAGGVMDALGWKEARYITKSSRISNIMKAYEKKKAVKRGRKNREKTETTGIPQTIQEKAS